MQVDKVRGVQVAEVTPVHVIHKLATNDPRDEWKKALSLPVIHPKIVHDDFYGPNGKLIRTSSSFSVTV